MRLLQPDAFAHVFEPLAGKRVGFVEPLGNVGDELIGWATRQLFAEFGIRWKIQDPDRGADDVDVLVYGGGGNMGSLYQANWEQRSKCLQLGPPVTIFPQSYNSAEDRPFRRVYIRETASRRYAPQGLLAPDLALGLAFRTTRPPSRPLGIFLRRDKERAASRRWLRRDPVKLCRTPQEYLDLAARHEHIITDRLHFAICGLIAGRRTTLLPNSYHKNAGMYETWLKDLGCEFARNVAEARSRRRAA